MAEDISISISQDSIQKIVQTRIQAEVLKALEADAGTLVQKLIEQSLNMKVRKDYTDYRFFDLMLSEVIQAETRKVFQEWVEANRDKIRAGIEKALAKDKSGTARIVDSLVKGITSDWAFRVELKAYTPSER